MHMYVSIYIMKLEVLLQERPQDSFNTSILCYDSIQPEIILK